MPPPRPSAKWSARTRPRARPGCRRSEIPPSNECFPPRTPIVSITGTPQAAILLPSHTPPVDCQPIVWPRSAPALATSPNRASSAGVIGLGGRAKWPWMSIATSCSAATSATERVDQACARAWSSSVARAQIDAQDGKVGHDIVRAAAVDPRRIDRQAAADPGLEAQRKVGGGDQRVAPVLRIAPGMGRPAAHGETEIAAARPRAGEGAVGQRRGS